MSGKSTTSSPTEGHSGHFRWVICGLLFLATAINYLDRSVLGVLAATLQKEIGWSNTEYGDINGAFMLAYALGFLVLGWFVDRVGTRIGYAVSLTFWSLAAAAHAFAQSVAGFTVARFFLGFGEAGNFPAALKAVAEWFPRRERALATGIFIAGTNVGAVLAPLMVPWLTLTWGWQAAFALTGLIGLIWVFAWLPVYRKPEDHPCVSPSELDHILSDREAPAKRVRWAALAPHRQTWAIAIVKFLTDPIWWFYLFWSGKFIQEKFDVDLKSIGGPLICIYVLADAGSVAGGWFSSALMKRGWTANAARKTALIVCSLCVLPVMYAPVTDHLWTAVLLISLAAACHQGFAANVFTLASDMFPKRAVGSVVGLGGMAGAVGGYLLQIAAGRIKDLTGSYLAMFVIAGSIYLLAVAVMHLICPRCKPVAEIG